MIERVARLAGKIAIITGAGSGIGRATAQCFLREGAAVVGGIFEPGDDPGPGVTAVHCDVTSEADVRRLVDTAVARHGGLDILVNNAGIGHSGLVTETTDGE